MPNRSSTATIDKDLIVLDGGFERAAQDEVVVGRLGFHVPGA